MNKIFLRFRRKLMIEALCRSFLMGLLIGGGAELAFLIVMHLISRNPGWISIGCVFAVPFLLTFFILFGAVYFPTQRRIARRIDQSGLEERAGTMLEFKDGNSPILEMQRTDAVQRIQSISLKQIPFRISPKVGIACVIVAAMSVGSMFVPYDIMSMLRAEASSLSKAEAAMFRALLEALRNETAESDIADGLKEQLYDGFDILEDDLGKAEGELEKAAQLAAAEARVKDTLEGEISKDQIGPALQAFGAVSDLGKAMEKGDTEGLSAALEKMKSEILARDSQKQAERLTRISSNIESALAASGISESDRLYSALSDLAKAFRSSAEGALSKADVSGELEEAVRKGEGAINALLNEQNEPDALLDRLLELLGDAKRSTLNADFPIWETEAVPGENPEGETAETEQNPSETDDPAETKDPENENTDRENSDNDSEQDPNSSSQTEDGDPEQSGQSSDGPMNTMKEGIFDPTLGNVEYGQVFAAYYAEYLASVNNGQIPEDMRELLEEYFESLNN